MRICRRVAFMLFSYIFGVLMLVYMIGRQSTIYLESLPRQNMLVEFDDNSAIPLAPTLYKSIPNLMVSTCSDQATKRGPNQRVVSFCLYGQLNHSRHYFEGIEANAALVHKMYPGWMVRIYLDIPANNKNAYKALSELQHRFKHLDICSCSNIPGYQSLIGTQQLIWRFLPMADSLVELFISRDLDSRISHREVMAVEEWLDSGLTFHVMRDHRQHDTTVLGGMWGARVHMARELLLTITAQMFTRGRQAQNEPFDQTLLTELAWPVMKGHVMQHDSYMCKRFARHGHMRPWPTRRPLNEEYNFVGSRIGVLSDARPMKTICPLACRPVEHKNWITC